MRRIPFPPESSRFLTRSPRKRVRPELLRFLNSDEIERRESSKGEWPSRVASSVYGERLLGFDVNSSMRALNRES